MERILAERENVPMTMEEMLGEDDWLDEE